MKKRLFSFLCIFLGCLQMENLQAQEQTLEQEQNLLQEQALQQEQQLASPAQTFLSTTQTQLEIEVFNMINQNRVANFLPPLNWSDIVAEQARSHSLNMANKIVPFSHQGANDRFYALARAIPSLTRFGENVAYNFGYSNPSATAVSGWLKSPGHYANIMGDFNLTGVGVARNSRGEYYFTQIFVKANQTVTLKIPTADKALCTQVSETICDTPVLIENH